MLSPKEYLSSNSMQRQGVVYVLNSYLPKMKFLNDGTEVIMDAGCGTGDVTMDILLPKLPSRLNQFIGTDISKDAVTYCREKYATEDGKISFDLLDIGTTCLPSKFQNQCNHIFSFFCVHWCDLNAVFKNIHSILKPGGEGLICFLNNNYLLSTWAKLAKSEKWKQYFGDDHKIPSQLENRTVDEYTAMLNNAGFKNSVCTIDRIDYPYKNREEYVRGIMAMNFLISHLDEHMQMNFISETIDDHINLKYISYEDDDGIAMFTYQMVILQPKKPF